MRPLLIVTLLAAAFFAAYWLQRSGAERDARFSYVTTAHQSGVVGYRDPVGAFSIDGRRVAFTEGRHLFEMPVAGGVRSELGLADGQIRHLSAFGPSTEWIFEDTGASPRWWAVSAGASKRPLFGARTEITATAGTPAPGLRVDALRQLVASPDGRWIAAVVARSDGLEVWRLSADGQSAEIVHGPAAVSFPAWTASGDIACILTSDGRAQLSVPCGDAPVTLNPSINVIGPIAFAPAQPIAFFAAANERGFVDLWSADLSTRKAHRLTSFERDTYAPSLAGDGRLLFKVQNYRTSVAELDVRAGTVRQLSTLQAETPSYHPDGQRVAVTYGTWRRVIDDAKYPDIAQEIGLVPAGTSAAPVAAPVEVIANSDSEDQAMAWSPNGRWIVLHSHREQSDDIWLRRADGQQPDRRVSFLGRGAEVGWPRWSSDGKRVLFDGASPRTGRSALFVIGIDQDSGVVSSEPVEVSLSGFQGEITHAEWMPDSSTVVAIAKEAPGQHVILIAPVAGGPVRVLHRFRSEHDFPGLAIHPDGSRIAFVAPGSEGCYQIFALPTAGGIVQALTIDGTHKTQPAWSPDGRRIAFTIWSYDAQFWALPDVVSSR